MDKGGQWRCKCAGVNQTSGRESMCGGQIPEWGMRGVYDKKRGEGLGVGSCVEVQVRVRVWVGCKEDEIGRGK